MTTIHAAAVLVLVGLVAAGCGSGAASVAPESPTLAPRPSVPPSVTGSIPPSTPAGQTDTDWGRIWDTLPSDFPTFPGSTPAEETATGPASANLVVNGGKANEIATFFQTRLEQAGFRTQGVSGPLEDGGYVLDMTGPVAGCDVNVAVTPKGSLTTVTILYGADCPHG